MERRHPLGGVGGLSPPVRSHPLSDLQEEEEEVPDEVPFRKRLEKAKLLRRHPFRTRVKATRRKERVNVTDPKSWGRQREMGGSPRVTQWS